MNRDAKRAAAMLDKLASAFIRQAEESAKVARELNNLSDAIKKAKEAETHDFLV